MPLSNFDILYRQAYSWGHSDTKHIPNLSLLVCVCKKKIKNKKNHLKLIKFASGNQALMDRETLKPGNNRLAGIKKNTHTHHVPKPFYYKYQYEQIYKTYLDRTFIQVLI